MTYENKNNSKWYWALKRSPILPDTDILKRVHSFNRRVFKLSSFTEMQNPGQIDASSGTVHGKMAHLVLIVE